MDAPAEPQSAEPPLALNDLPELHDSGNEFSLTGQRRFVRSTAAQLVLLVVAAVATAVNVGGDIPTIVAAAAFLGAALLKVQLLATRPERAWYEGRAAAESAKTLAWRYAVGGAPLGVDMCTLTEANQFFLGRLRDIRSDLDLPLVESAGRVEQITDDMKRLRARPLRDRRQVYIRDRLEDQLSWYTRKAIWNEKRARQWNLVILALMAGGGLFALASLTSGLNLDPIDALAAAVGGIAAWIATKQHSTLASAYSVTARELADIVALAEEPNTEEEWARFVSSSEEAISREHTMWRASRGQ